jgi:ubiquinone/menaquinone biosynthesis C-methylase UbiE
VSTDIPAPTSSELTDRQSRELAYHRERALQFEKLKDQPVGIEVVTSTVRFWWNPYWHVYSLLRTWPLDGKKALVLGCGYGEDAIRLNSLGMEVSACDLSPEATAIAQARGKKNSIGRLIDVRQMAAEKLLYEDSRFDLILAVDILHHVDIPRVIRELRRVAAPNCILVCLEMYTHSWLTRIRESRLISRYLYPALVEWVYGTKKPYITADERKLNEKQLKLIAQSLTQSQTTWFHAIINRLVPDRFENIEKCDRITLKLLGPIGSILAGRVILTGQILK